MLTSRLHKMQYHFNPILVRFKHDIMSFTTASHSKFQSYFSPIQTFFIDEFFPPEDKFQSYFSPIQTNEHLKRHIPSLRISILF